MRVERYKMKIEYVYCPDCGERYPSLKMAHTHVCQKDMPVWDSGRCDG